MSVVASIDWDLLGWGTRLARAHAKGELPPPLAAPRRPFDRDGQSRRQGGAVLAELAATGIGRSGWSRLVLPGARAVVSGQQPGCVGGPALAAYKAATAVALARRLERAGGVPVVPVFWNATDDEDFDEIARVGWLDDGGRLGFLELPPAGRGGWIGDLPAPGDESALRAALGESAGAYSCPAAKDHGEWVGHFLVRLFPDLAVVDARSAALRRHAAPLFARYLDDVRGAHDAVERQISAVAAAGFERTLAAASLRAGLFLTPARRREKTPADDVRLRTAVRDAPETLSPNVLLRAFVQDSLLPVAAHVVGPAEIGYLIELRALRARLGIEEPALMLRLSATWVDAPVWKPVVELGLDPAVVLRDPDAAIASRAAGSVRAAQADVEDAFRSLHGALAGVELPPDARQRTQRRLQGVQDELQAALLGAGRDRLVAEYPVLSRLAASVRPRGQAQERILAALWIASRGVSGERLVELADVHLEALASGSLRHFVVAREGSSA